MLYFLLIIDLHFLIRQLLQKLLILLQNSQYLQEHYLIKQMQKSSILYSKYIVSDLPSIFVNISCGIYSIPRESKYTAVSQSINHEIQSVPLLCLSSIFITYAPSFILGKLSLEKTTLNVRLTTEILSNLHIA